MTIIQLFKNFVQTKKKFKKKSPKFEKYRFFKVRLVWFFKPNYLYAKKKKLAKRNNPAYLRERFITKK
jgi:hypothetical protein